MNLRFRRFQHFDSNTFQFVCLAPVRHAAEFVEQQAVDRPMLEHWNFGVEQLVDLLQIRAAIREDFVPADVNDGIVGNVQFVGDFADELFQDVLESDDSVGASMLVDDDSQVNPSRPEICEQLDQGDGMRHEERLTCQRTEFRVVSPRDQRLEGIPHVEHSGNVVQGSAMHRYATIGDVAQLGRDFAQLSLRRPREDLSAWSHDLPGTHRVQGKGSLDQLPFVFLDRPGFVAQQRQCPDLRFGNTGNRSAVRQDEPADGLERQDDR